jgi:large subunit ribosomal protein L21
MYAIVEIAGQQFKVAKDQKLFVHRLKEDEGASVTFDNVLLIDDGAVTIGAPAINGAAVTAKVVKHLKGDKVIVFKKKRRKGYKLRNGHRQYLTELVIEGITASGNKSAKKAAPKAKPAAKKVEAAAVAPAKAEKPAKKASKKTTKKGDDLKKVEGIGPKIAEHFNNAGIFTFEELANTEVSKLQEILTAAGPRYKMHNPGSWPKQARMAADGNWDELKVWQDAHDKGIE